MWFRVSSFIFLVFIFNCVFAQTFQYSRGWTNGKRAYPLNPTACQYHRLKALLEGKPLPHSYILCELQQPYTEDGMKQYPRVNLEKIPLSEDVDTK